MGAAAIIDSIDSIVCLSSTGVLSLVFVNVSDEKHTLGLGGRGGRVYGYPVIPCPSRVASSEPFGRWCSLPLLWSWRHGKCPEKFVLTSLIVALLFAVANAGAFFFALSGAFSLYALTWWTCAAIQ
jgi:hypothetical protein